MDPHPSLPVHHHIRNYAKGQLYLFSMTGHVNDLFSSRFPNKIFESNVALL